MSDDTDDAGMFDEFADAIEEKLSKFSEQIRIYRNEWQELRNEQRSAPVPATQPIIDTDALAVRAAALVPAPTVDTAAIAAEAALIIARNSDLGKVDRVVNNVLGAIDLSDVAKRAAALVPTPNVAELEARIAEVITPKIAALIPPAVKGEKGDRGEDGCASPEEIRAIVREEQLANRSSFYKGVYQSDSGYRTSDGVTYAGSMWFATHDNPTVKPGQGDGWILGVKCGRDGKDARK